MLRLPSNSGIPHSIMRTPPASPSGRKTRFALNPHDPLPFSSVDNRCVEFRRFPEVHDAISKDVYDRTPIVVVDNAQLEMQRSVSLHNMDEVSWCTLRSVDALVLMNCRSITGRLRH